MFSGDDLEKMLNRTMETKISCRKCGTTFTFEEGADCARENGINDKVVICKKCYSVYEVDVTPRSITLLADVTHRYPLRRTTPPASPSATQLSPELPGWEVGSDESRLSETTAQKPDTTSLIQQVVEVEAESLEKAREQVKSKIPEGFYLLSEEVILDGIPKTVKAGADTTQAAFAKAQSEIPINANIIEKKELTTPEQKIIMVEAFDEQSAMSSARGEAGRQFGNTAIVKSVKLVSAGSKGFLGVGKKPNQYEAELLQQAVVEITYKTKANISVKIVEIETLLAALKDKDRSVRQMAAQLLGKLKEHRAVESLCVIALNLDEDKEVREAAWDALQELGETVMARITGLKGRNPEIRRAMAVNLGYSDDTRAIEPLIAALKDEDNEVRWGAAMSLGELGDSRAVEPLIASLDDKDQLVRKRAKESLKHIGGPEAKEALAVCRRE